MNTILWRTDDYIKDEWIWNYIHNPNFENELHLEKSFRLIDKKVYYNGGFSFAGGYPKGIYIIEAMSLIMSKKKIIWHNKNDLTYVYNNLKKCGCCERHSCGVTMDPHNTNIKTHKTYRTRLQNLYSPADTDCKCCCRHYMRFILRKFPEIEPKPQIFNILLGTMSFVGPRPALYNQYDLIRYFYMEY